MGTSDYGFAALGMQVGTPAVVTIGALYAGAVASGGDDDLGSIALTGAILGAVVAIGVDAGVFAWITEAPPEIVPTVHISSEVSTFGLGGRF